MVAQALSIIDLSQTFREIQQRLTRSWNKFRTQPPGQWAEQQLVLSMLELWPDNPLLFRWVPKSLCEDVYRMIRILPNEDTPVVPPDFVSINGLDGLPFYQRKLFQSCAIMACRVRNGKPVSSMVMMLDRCELFHTGITQDAGVFMGTYSHAHWVLPQDTVANSFIGVDATPVVSDQFQDLVVSKFLKSHTFARTLIVSPGAGAMGVLGGHLAAYIAYNPFHCDIAATAALCKAAGQIVCHLDGTPIDWRRFQLSFPVVFARDASTFEFVRQLSEEYIKCEHIAHAF